MKVFCAIALASLLVWSMDGQAREAKEQVEKRMQAAARLIVAVDDETVQQATVAAAVIDSTLTTEGRKAFSALNTNINQWRADVANKRPIAAGRRGTLEREIAALFGVDIQPSQTPDLPTAIATYRAHCQSCHGDAGRGDGALASKIKSGVPSFVGGGKAGGRPAFVVDQIIIGGRPGTAMPAFGEKLDATAIWSVSFYVLAFNANGSKSAEEALRTWSAVDPATRTALSHNGLSLGMLSSRGRDETSAWLRAVLAPEGKSPDLSRQTTVENVLRGAAPFVKDIGHSDN